MGNSLNYKKAIVSVMTTVLGLSSESNAAVVFASTGDGNIEVSTSGADSYVLDGHFVITSPYLAEVLSGVVVTGDGGAPLQVVVDDYSIRNSGSILSNGVTAVEITADIINHGSGSALSGFFNTGVIASNTHPGIDASTNRVDLVNLGSISTDEAMSVAIGLGHESVLENGRFVSTDFGITGMSGSIVSAGIGVIVGENASVHNSFQSEIRGEDSAGLIASHGVDLINEGIIGGGTSGVTTAHNAMIQNSVGGAIFGASRGVGVGNDSQIQNEGEVTAIGSNGIAVEFSDSGQLNNSGEVIAAASFGIGVLGASSLSVSNAEDGSIYGSLVGVRSLDGAVIINTGEIRSAARAVEEEAGVLELDNNGLIQGSIGVDAGAGNDSVLSSGVITALGGTSVDLGSGDDGIVLSTGSVVSGDILGGVGNDEITFDGETLTTGDVSGFEQANKFNSGLSRITSGRLESNVLNVGQGELILGGGVSGATTTTVGGAGRPAELGGRTQFISTNTVIGTDGVLSAGNLPLSYANDFFDHLGSTVGEISHIGEIYFDHGAVLRVDTDPTFGGSSDVVNVIGDVEIEPGSMVQIGPFDVNRVQQDGDYLAIAVEPGGILTGNFSSAVFVLEEGLVNVVERNTPNTPYDVINTGVFESSTVHLQSVVIDESVFVRLTHDYSGVPGITSSGEVFGSYLNTLLDDAVSNPMLSDFLAFLDYSNGELVADILNSYAPAVHGALANSALQHGNTLFQVVRNQQQILENSTPVILLKDEKGGMMSIEADENNMWSLWGSVSFEAEVHELSVGDIDLDDLDGERSSLVLGLNHTVNDKLTVGVAAMLAKSEIRGGEPIETEAEIFSIYANLGTTLGWKASGLVGYGDYSIDSSRFIFPETAEASYGANGLLVAVNGSYLMGGNRFNWGPTFGFEYRQADVDSFTESGPMGLTINARNVESIRLLLGLEGSKRFDRVRWFGSARWTYDVSANNQDAIEAGFAGLPGGFSVESPRRSEHALLLGTGISSYFGERNSIGVSYFGEVPISGEGATYHGGAIEFKIMF